MNTILDKLGIYDLIANLLSGMCIITITVLILQHIIQISIANNVKIDETVLFLVMSYFAGTIFQEVSSFIQKKILYKNHALLKSVLNLSNYSYTFLTKIEKDAIYDFVIKELLLDPLQDNDYVVYCYCKFKVREFGKTERVDKDQSISAMSRSLSLYFFLVFVGVCTVAVFKKNKYYLGVSLFALFLFCLFFYRCIRFAKQRYVYFFRLYYYNILLKNQKEI